MGRFLGLLALIFSFSSFAFDCRELLRKLQAVKLEPEVVALLGEFSAKEEGGLWALMEGVAEDTPMTTADGAKKAIRRLVRNLPEAVREAAEKEFAEIDFKAQDGSNARQGGAAARRVLQGLAVVAEYWNQTAPAEKKIDPARLHQRAEVVRLLEYVKPEKANLELFRDGGGWQFVKKLPGAFKQEGNAQENRLIWLASRLPIPARGLAIRRIRAIEWTASDFKGDTPALQRTLRGLEVIAEEWNKVAAEADKIDPKKLENIQEIEKLDRVLPKIHEELLDKKTGAWTALTAETRWSRENGVRLFLDEQVAPLPASYREWVKKELDEIGFLTTDGEALADNPAKTMRIVRGLRVVAGAWNAFYRRQEIPAPLNVDKIHTAEEVKKLLALNPSQYQQRVIAHQRMQEVLPLFRALDVEGGFYTNFGARKYINFLVGKLPKSVQAQAQVELQAIEFSEQDGRTSQLTSGYAASERIRKGLQVVAYHWNQTSPPERRINLTEIDTPAQFRRLMEYLEVPIPVAKETN